MKYLLAGICLATAFVIPHPLIHGGDRVALVIGVDKYDELSASQQLSVAASDATLLARTLEALDQPFQTTLLTDSRREDAAEALEEFVESAETAECALVYFAGHGIEFHGENYLLMRDTNVLKIRDSVPRMKDKLYYEALSLRKVISDLEDTGASIKVIILDACRDNPLEAATASGTRSVVGSSGGLGRVSAPSGMLISYSADAGQQANDGLFTEILCRHIQEKGSTILNVFATTREEVRAQALSLQKAGKGRLHEPAEYTKLGPAALSFSFNPGSPAVAPAVPVAQKETKNIAPVATVIQQSPHLHYVLLAVVGGVAVIMSLIAFLQYRKFSLHLASANAASRTDDGPGNDLSEARVEEEFSSPEVSYREASSPPTEKQNKPVESASPPEISSPAEVSETKTSPPPL